MNLCIWDMRRSPKLETLLQELICVDFLCVLENTPFDIHVQKQVNNPANIPKIYPGISREVLDHCVPPTQFSKIPIK